MGSRFLRRTEKNKLRVKQSEKVAVARLRLEGYMGLFDKLMKKEKNVTKQVQIQKEKQEMIEDGKEALGWQAIEEEFLRVYPDQVNPRHYGTLVKWIFGGNDPLDGISIYDGGTYWHFISFGLTEIYEKESDDKEVSGYGYELTFKLKKEAYENEEVELKNICGILQSIARLVFNNGEIFCPDEFIYTGQTTGIDAFQKSNITGFITIKDPTVESIDTPNGKVDFLELIGLTDAELKTLSSSDTVRKIYAELGTDITDYHRESVR